MKIDTTFIARFFVIYLLVIFGWIGFLVLARGVSIDSTSSLIMVWASVVLLTLAVVPDVLSGLKRIKVGDIEVELNQAVENATAKELITTTDIKLDINAVEKSDIGQLITLYNEAVKQTGAPLVLLVNIRSDSSISIPLLYIYSLFLSIPNSNVILVFVSAKRQVKSLMEVYPKEILGAVDSHDFINLIYQNFPGWIWPERLMDMDKRIISEVSNLLNPEIIHSFYDNLRRTGKFNPNLNEREYLSIEKLNKWFGRIIDTNMISNALTKKDLHAIFDDISKNRKYIFMLDNNRCISVLSLDEIARTISKKAILSAI